MKLRLLQAWRFSLWLRYSGYGGVMRRVARLAGFARGRCVAGTAATWRGSCSCRRFARSSSSRCTCHRIAKTIPIPSTISLKGRKISGKTSDQCSIRSDLPVGCASPGRPRPQQGGTPQAMRGPGRALPRQNRPSISGPPPVAEGPQRPPSALHILTRSMPCKGRRFGMAESVKITFPFFANLTACPSAGFLPWRIRGPEER